jgi:hypothetical protein
MPAQTVDSFVKQKVPPALKPIVATVRELMREWAPKADEKISYGMLVWSGNLIFAWIIPTKKDITFGFMQGAYFEDKYGLLQGTGKHARHVKLKKLEDVQKTILRYYVRQAMKIDKSRFPSTPSE